jgi:hypothetical protein
MGVLVWPTSGLFGYVNFVDISVPVGYNATLPVIHHVLGYPIVSLGKRRSECPSRQR